MKRIFQEFAIHFNIPLEKKQAQVFMDQNKNVNKNTTKLCIDVNHDDFEPIKTYIQSTKSISHHKYLMIAENFHYCLYFIHSMKSLQQ